MVLRIHQPYNISHASSGASRPLGGAAPLGVFHDLFWQNSIFQPANWAICLLFCYFFLSFSFHFFLNSPLRSGALRFLTRVNSWRRSIFFWGFLFTFFFAYFFFHCSFLFSLFRPLLGGLLRFLARAFAAAAAELFFSLIYFLFGSPVNICVYPYIMDSL